MKRLMVSSVAALALLGSAMAGTTGTSVADGSSDARVKARDAEGQSVRHASAGSARVLDGQDIRRDPNTYTRREAAALEAHQQQVLERSGMRTSPRPNGSVTVPIEFHNIANRRGEGFVSMKQIRAQVRVLNRAYSGRTSPDSVNTPFRFRLNSVDRTRNSGWYNAKYFSPDGKAELREMRRALHVGNARHLNVYTVGPKLQLLGFATLPDRRAPRLDGTVLWNGSLPGGDADLGPGSVYNRGDTATHEVGHWLNLYHTFQGGCGRLNDFVADTPRQEAGENIFEEDPTLNTCRPYTERDRDPVRNFMNYTDDPFMNQFTRGQRDRMSISWFIRKSLAQSD